MPAPSSARLSLRRLWRHVHPDLFARWPEARATNQRAMQELQGLLQQGRNGQAGAPGMLQMPTAAQPLAQRPTNAAEPMILWGDEQQPGDTPDSWYL